MVLFMHGKVSRASTKSTCMQQAWHRQFGRRQNMLHSAPKFTTWLILQAQAQAACTSLSAGSLRSQAILAVLTE